jgi:hypothetical protein
MEVPNHLHAASIFIAFLLFGILMTIRTCSRWA